MWSKLRQSSCLESAEYATTNIDIHTQSAYA